jgi:hypothetical protein
MNAPCHSGAAWGDKYRSLCQLIHDAQNHLNAVKGLGLILGDSSTHFRASVYRDCLESEARQLADLLEGIRTHLSGQDEKLLHGATFELSDAHPTGLTARIVVPLEHDKGVSS